MGLEGYHSVVFRIQNTRFGTIPIVNGSAIILWVLFAQIENDGYIAHLLIGVNEIGLLLSMWRLANKIPSDLIAGSKHSHDRPEKFVVWMTGLDVLVGLRTIDEVSELFAVDVPDVLIRVGYEVVDHEKIHGCTIGWSTVVVSATCSQGRDLHAD